MFSTRSMNSATAIKNLWTMLDKHFSVWSKSSNSNSFFFSYTEIEKILQNTLEMSDFHEYYHGHRLILRNKAWIFETDDDNVFVIFAYLNLGYISIDGSKFFNLEVYKNRCTFYKNMEL